MSRSDAANYSLIFRPLRELHSVGTFEKGSRFAYNNYISLIMTEYCLDDGDQSFDDENSLMEHELYPAPHNAPRSPRMDNGCWEIKWDHRDDCVSALMVNDFCFY